MTTPTHWFERLGWFGSARQLAVVRIVFGLHLISVFTSPSVSWFERIQPKPMLFARTIVPEGLEALLTPAVNATLNHLGLGLAVLLVFGLGTRIVTWAVFVVFFLTQHYWFRHSLVHDEWIYLTFQLLVLAFARCGDAWSLDARLGWGHQADNRQTYRWPLEWMILWMALVYVAAGLSKITPLPKGWMWLSGATVQDFTIWFSRESPLFWWLGETPFDYRTVSWPFAVSSWATVLVELGAIALLFDRRSHLPVCIAIGGMHAVIWALGIPFFPPIFLTQAVLLRFSGR